MSDVTYTDTITVQVLDSSITPTDMIYARASIEVTAPLSAWIDHEGSGFEYIDQPGEYDGFAPSLPEPLFYIPGPHPSLDTIQRYLIRGSLETLAEEGWEAYRALLDVGVDPVLARSALPSHFMLTRTVKASGLQLYRFVEQHRSYRPGSEIAVIAAGYARHLAEVGAASVFPS